MLFERPMGSCLAQMSQIYRCNVSLSKIIFLKAKSVMILCFSFRCQANVEQAGSVTFDGETIEGAPPLWCAAAAGTSQLTNEEAPLTSAVNK
jgi:hypothetical protein